MLSQKLLINISGFEDLGPAPEGWMRGFSGLVLLTLTLSLR